MNFPIHIYQRAFEALPLPWLMTKLGDGAFTKKNAKCPFCDSGGGKWKVFPKNNRHFFKCHKPGCVANEVSPDIGHHELGYLVLRKSLSVEEAKEEFIKLALPQEYERFKAEREKRQRKEGDATCTPETPEATAGSPATSKGDAAPKGSTPEAAAGAPPPPPANVVPFAPGPPPPETPNPWHALWTRFILTPADREKLKRERGFSDDTISALGFKSNNQSNRLHLESLKDDFPMDLLLAEGIFRLKRDGPAPNDQLLGLGITRKAKKEGEQDQWGYTYPVLIPYLDEHGTCFHLRPHKGFIAGQHDDDEDEEEPTCRSHVYCPFLLAKCSATLEGTAVLTEGEFKAGALFQCGIPVLAIPGVTFVRNLAFRAELLGLLRHFAITDLVIVFDNEVKDDPAYPARYKPNPNDRYDAQMWAEYIAVDLTTAYFGPHKGRVRIGMLPDNLREEGKADFDSGLSYFVRQRRDVARGTEAACKVFQRVVAQARPRQQARDLFPSESRRIIERKLSGLFYKPNVTFGGDKEMRFANACQAAGESEVAKAYRSIIGCYYVREPLPEKEQRKLALEKATAASRAVEQAKAAGVNGSEIRAIKTKASAAWQIFKGLPVAISDFILSCEFKLFSPEGKADYLVRIRNKADAKWDGKLYRFTSDQLGRGPEFCCTVLGTGKGVWKGGTRNLTELQEDMAHQAYMRDIYQVNLYGYHGDSKIWFFGDCAYSPAADLIEADKNNVFWHAGVGYQVDSSVSERGTTFEQGAPLMLSPYGAKPKDIDLAELFHDLCLDMFFTVGGYDAWLMLGLLFAYAAAPELLKLGGHPAPWLFGKMSGGKTTIARWLMRIWGFKDLGGVGIDDRTTPVGMNRFLAQYSCLPVWFDEYRQNHADPQKEAVIRGAFDRNSGAKGLQDHTNRTRSAKIYTTPMITGEGSSSDAATRSRYGHVNINDHRRIGDGVTRYAKIQDECKFYYLVGRFLMERRTKFVEKMLQLHDEWMSEQKVRSRIVNERVRFVYATAWSAFITLSRMFEGPGADERAGMEFDFREALLVHGEQALQDVFSETFSTRFWTDMASGIDRGKIRRRFFPLRYVERLEDGTLKQVTAGDAKAEHVMYLVAKPAFDEYAQDLRTRGQSPPLDIGDLRREMAKEPYWILPPSKEPRCHRLKIEGSMQTCWVISLEKFPFAEDFLAVLEKEEL